MDFTINLDKSNDELTIINDLSGIIDATHLEKISINIISNENHFIDFAALIIVVALYTELVQSGYKSVDVSFTINENNDKHQYLSRINFFQLLSIEYVESFRRQNTAGSLLEITNVSKGSMVYGLTEDIIQIIERSFELDLDTRETIVLILNELICNTSIHAKTKSGGYVYCQRYSNRGRLELIIADAGIGIKRSLSSKFPSLTNKEAVEKSIEFGVSSGHGHGMGLNWIYEIVKRNMGEMILISGENSLHLNNGVSCMRTHAHWQGVVVKCVFNLNNKFTTKDYLRS